MGLRKNIGKVGSLEVRDFVAAEIGRVPKPAPTPPNDAAPEPEPAPAPTEPTEPTE